MKAKSELRFEIAHPDKVHIRDIQRVVREAWRDMRQPGTSAYANLIESGLDPGRLPKRMSGLIEVKPGAAGITSVEVLVVLALERIAKDLWRYVILPQIRHHWGDQALKRKREAPDSRSVRTSKKKTVKAKRPPGRKTAKKPG